MFRLISMPLHSALEIGIASAVMVAPFVFGLGAAALVTSVVIGAVLMGLALSGSGPGRGSLPVSAHAAYDGGIGVGLVGAGLVFGVAGDAAALGVFALACIVHLALTASTRYTAVPAGV